MSPGRIPIYELREVWVSESIQGSNELYDPSPKENERTKMNRLSFASVAVAISMAAGTVLAGPTATFNSQASGWGSLGSGGPFLFTAGGGLETQIRGLNTLGAGANQWLTFCLEHNENISGGTTYDATIDTVAWAGGLGNQTPGAYIPGTPPSTPVLNSPTGVGDALDARTAYLYTQFMNGTLGTLTGGAFVYAPGGGADGAALQSAIWYLENEISDPAAGLATTLVNLAQSSVNSGAWTGLGNVRVLNLTKMVAGQRELFQSQLVIIPLPGAASMATAGLATMIGFGVLRRRR